MPNRNGTQLQKEKENFIRWSVVGYKCIKTKEQNYTNLNY